VLPMNVFLIYIRKHFVVFSHLGFHINLGVLCICGFFYALMNDIVYEAMIY
jgi:hypothetical protein